MKSPEQEYEAYRATIGDRRALYASVAQRFKIRRALYPGSHIDIAPSWVIPDVTYIDSFKGAIRFFRESDAIRGHVEANKAYAEPCTITFFARDYRDELPIEPVDLVISQYAGFVGQAAKRYLKPGGILLCNDSHGDATLAFFDDDYEFIAVADSGGVIETSGLRRHFQFARRRAVDLERVTRTMKGPRYSVRADNYLFRLKAVSARTR